MVDNSSIWTSHKVFAGGDINKVTFHKMLKRLCCDLKGYGIFDQITVAIYVIPWSYQASDVTQ